MTTIEELIDALDATQRGQIFLINLYRTLECDFLSATQVKAVCEEFLRSVTAGGYSLPPTIELADRLGSTCVAKGLWLEGPEPILERHLLKREFILSRVTSYSGFFYSVLKRKKGMPTITYMPEPFDLSIGTSAEISISDVSKVRHTLNNQKWRALIVDNVRLDAHCIWLAPLPKLKKKIGLDTKKNLADFHRDMIGLSHFSKGQHLIRLDLDLGQWFDWTATLRRRPHGAGNGGRRFRLQYDGRKSSCHWGRTVDLARVAAENARNLNGIPELLMEGFSIPKGAVTATYLGPIKNQPENNDSYFLDRLKKNQMIPNIVADLKNKLK